MGLRPDHATVVYSNLVRRVYRHVPIVLGGIEASLRRLAHYDYWSDSLKRSILLDSGADLLIYGMGELSVVEVADALDSGLPASQVTWVHGTVYKTRSIKDVDRPLALPTWEEMQADKLAYARSFGTQGRNLDPFSARTLVEEYPHSVYVVQNPPTMPLTTQQMDETYELPYERTYHPMYEAAGGVPAIKEVKFSIANNRGCLGQCSFCALNFHEGRIIQSRSHASILREARLMTQDPDFKGYINDLSGPTADFRIPACQKQLKSGACPNRRCLAPEPCPNLRVTHEDLVQLLRELRAVPGVKKVFIRSGIRFDYAMLDPDHTFIKELAEYHTSGQLRLAPEHISDKVLEIMGKPHNHMYEDFCKEFEKYSRQAGKEQYVLPYLMSSHPGSTMREAVKLAEFCRDLGYNPEQVSDFYPTPSTVDAASPHPVPQPQELRPGGGGPAQGPPRGPHRLRPQVPGATGRPVAQQGRRPRRQAPRPRQGVRRGRPQGRRQAQRRRQRQSSLHAARPRHVRLARAPPGQAPGQVGLPNAVQSPFARFRRLVPGRP